MLAEISAKVSDINTNITNMEARTGDDQQARIDMTVEISDVKHLEQVIKSIKGVQGVLGVERTRASVTICRRSIKHRDRRRFRRARRAAAAPPARSSAPAADRRRTAVDLVHRREIIHVGQEHRRPHDVREAGARGAEAAPSMLRITCSVCAEMSPWIRAPVAGSMGICPR